MGFYFLLLFLQLDSARVHVHHVGEDSMDTSAWRFENRVGTSHTKIFKGVFISEVLIYTFIFKV